MKFWKLISIATLGILSTSVNAALINVALTGTASQSSTYPASGNEASNAIDGNIDGLLAHTQYQARPWWRVDLDGSYDIRQVVIYNRSDCCQERLSNFNLFIKDENFGNITGRGFQSIQDTYVFNVNPYYSQYKASTIFIQSYRTDYLNIAEVQVFAEVNAVPVPAAAWLFGSGLIGLIGVARRKSHA